MNVYLPIAEMSVNVFLILGMGVGVGYLSGLFGVGGGFLMTPLLIFAGIPRPSLWRPAPIRSWPLQFPGSSPIGGAVMSISRWGSCC